jgi:outer membrane protein assembly factor BamA
MFNSIYSQRFFKWIVSPKKYLVNIEIKVGEKYTFQEIEVEARCKSEAYEKAKKKIFSEINIITKGCKSLGRLKNLNEF